MNASQTPARTVGLVRTHLEASYAPAELDIPGLPVKQTSMIVFLVSVDNGASVLNYFEFLLL